MSHDRASAIIIKNHQILVIFRKSEGEQFYSFPGGTIEPDETPENAVEREVKEETSLDVTRSDYLFSVQEPVREGGQRKNYFYDCDISYGTPTLAGPEKAKHSDTNYYEPMWISLETLHKSEWGTADEARKYIENYLASRK